MTEPPYAYARAASRSSGVAVGNFWWSSGRIAVSQSASTLASCARTEYACVREPLETTISIAPAARSRATSAVGCPGCPPQRSVQLAGRSIMAAMKPALAAALALAAAGLSSQQRPIGPADLLVVNGRVYSLTWAEPDGEGRPA